MKDFEIKNLRCSKCGEVFGLADYHEHETWAGAEHYPVRQCDRCKQWFQEFQFGDQSYCDNCYRISVHGTSESQGVFCQRATIYGEFRWLTSDGVSKVEAFVQDWLSPFEQTDRGLLAMLFHSRLVPTVDRKQTPEQAKLEKILEGGFLPKLPSELGKLKVLRDWLPRFEREAMHCQIDELNPESNATIRRDYAVRREVWGLDSGEIYPLRIVRDLLQVDTSEIVHCLIETKNLVGHSTKYLELNALNLERDKALITSN